MGLKDKRILVTGGAGFIGSHLVDSLAGRNEVVVIDDLSRGREEFLGSETEFYPLSLQECDLDEIMEGMDLVFHLAADPDVRNFDAEEQLDRNYLCTHDLLEAMRKTDTKRIVFASSSTVYGEAETPTPVDHPTVPISLYGAMKLSSEALISAYHHTFDFDAWIYRFANVVGSRLRHGVIYDFINKLRNDPDTLEILGDGRQRKSYIYIDDCINAMLTGLNSDAGLEILNIGTEDQVEVREIAEIVSEEMGLDPEFVYTGGRRGWRGDVPEMLLKPERLCKLGWEPEYGSREAIRRTTQDLLREI